MKYYFIIWFTNYIFITHVALYVSRFTIIFCSSYLCMPLPSMMKRESRFKVSNFSTNLSNTGNMVEMVCWGIESTCYLVKSKEREQAYKIGRCCKMRRVQHPLTFVSCYCSIYRRFLPVFTWIIGKKFLFNNNLYTNKLIIMSN